MAMRIHFFLKTIVLVTALLLLFGEKSFAQPEGSGAIMAIEEKPSAGVGRVDRSTAEGQGKTAMSGRSAALPAKAPTRQIGRAHV